MEAKAISREQREVIFAQYCSEPHTVPRYGNEYEYITRLLQVQAEISFKAGVREVVEWIEKRMSLKTPISSVYDDPGFIFTYGYEIHSVSEEDWQARLKEWK